LLRLESELQEARLETGRLAELAGRLNSELTRVRAGAGEDARSHADDEVQRLVATIGTPLVQLVTQHHLHRTGTAQVPAGDVLDVAMRLVGALREAGVDAVGEPGRAEPFDPGRHDPLSTAPVPVAGQPVLVRVIGLAYRGRVVRKAGIDAAAAGADGPGGR
jgi:hypothetical protein